MSIFHTFHSSCQLGLTKFHLGKDTFKGPLHVVWHVSFGCWITWFISSWQNSYNSVFFPKAEWCVFLNDKVCSYTKKTIWHLAIWQNWCSIIQKFARLKSKHFSQFFWWEVNLRGLRAFILQKVQASVVKRKKKKFKSWFGKGDTLIILLSAWDRSRDSTAKRNLSMEM